jgi:hypothetical protein
LISLVILLLSFAWTILTHPKRIPFKTEIVISFLIAMIFETYFFMIIDVLAQKKQEASTGGLVLRIP